jgi:Mlc titration factor MtfA (ptsG expression regulator)
MRCEKILRMKREAQFCNHVQEHTNTHTTLSPLMTYAIFTLLLLIVVFVIFYFKKKKTSTTLQTDSSAENEMKQYRFMLEQHVSFYRALNANEKIIFESEVLEFLSKVKIIGVDFDAEDLDRVLVAASAVIPLFAFHDWFYPNLDIVEMYADTFNHDFETSGANRQILGMVGSGVMNGRMALSRKALHVGFSNETDKRNTAIHEFIHLIDKSDGATDGVPEILLDKHTALPWLEFIREKIADIHEGASYIDNYGGTSETEFFAVAAEYFFERPELFEQKHPILFQKMVTMFRREPVLNSFSNFDLPGRNALCFCGSGKKYKRCCGG